MHSLTPHKIRRQSEDVDVVPDLRLCCRWKLGAAVAGCSPRDPIHLIGNPHQTQHIDISTYTTPPLITTDDRDHDVENSPRRLALPLLQHPVLVSHCRKSNYN